MKNQLLRYLQFSLGEENYAVKLLLVKEVIPVPETTPIPNSPSYYEGVMNLRGQIISVIDLRKRLNIHTKRDKLEPAVIIIESQSVAIGIIVDSINKVLNIDLAQITAVPEVSAQINAKYIEGVFNSAEGLTLLIDIEGVLNISEIVLNMKKAS
jgi:purine-binding chemotaxis protein CheW